MAIMWRTLAQIFSELLGTTMSVLIQDNNKAVPSVIILLHVLTNPFSSLPSLQLQRIPSTRTHTLHLQIHCFKTSPSLHRPYSQPHKRKQESQSAKDHGWPKCIAFLYYLSCQLIEHGMCPLSASPCDPLGFWCEFLGWDICCRK